MFSPFNQPAKKLYILAEYPESCVSAPCSANLSSMVSKDALISGPVVDPAINGTLDNPLDPISLISVKNNDFEFEIQYDCSQFMASDLLVQVKDTMLVVSTRNCFKLYNRCFPVNSFYRQYQLPKDVDTTKVQAYFNEDCVLRIRATKRWIDYIVPIVPETSSEEETEDNERGDEIWDVPETKDEIGSKSESTDDNWDSWVEDWP